jgi:hypothetical protein
MTQPSRSVFRGDVVEDAAVRAAPRTHVLVKRAQVTGRFAWLHRVPSGCASIGIHRPSGREIILFKGNAGAHVEELADGGARVARVA